MRITSYGSVRVFEPDREEVLAGLTDYAEEMSRRDEVLALWLIGSYHRKDFGPFSDVDMVLVVRKSSLRFLDRATKYLPERFPVAVDLFVYTVAEIEEMKKSGNLFWSDIEKNHSVLFERFPFL